MADWCTWIFVFWSIKEIFWHIITFNMLLCTDKTVWLWHETNRWCSIIFMSSKFSK